MQFPGVPSPQPRPDDDVPEDRGPWEQVTSASFRASNSLVEFAHAIRFQLFSCN